MSDLTGIDQQPIEKQFKLVFHHLEYNIRLQRDAFDVLLSKLSQSTLDLVESEMATMIIEAIVLYDNREINGLEDGFKNISSDGQQNAIEALVNLLPDGPLKTQLLIVLEG